MPNYEFWSGFGIATILFVGIPTFFKIWQKRDFLLDLIVQKRNEIMKRQGLKDSEDWPEVGVHPGMIEKEWLKK